MSSIYNICVSSKNVTKYNNSSLTVPLNKDIYIKDDEEMFITLKSFNMIKSFYECQAGLNNYFQVYITRNGEQSDEWNVYLEEGNYNIKILLETIQKQLSSGILMSISYNVKLNKFIYKSLFTEPNVKLYIKPINCGNFLGFENNITYEIKPEGTFSTTFINISGFTSLIIKLSGDIDLESSISNVNEDNVMKYDKILNILTINDVKQMDSITYTNNNDTKFKILNNKVSSISIDIVNENNEIFKNMADWIMVIDITTCKKEVQNQSNFYLKELRYFMMLLIDYLQIPTKLTMEDVKGNFV